MNGFALPLDGCIYLGEHGSLFDFGEDVRAHFGANGVSLCGEQRSARFSYFEIEEVAIVGPGTATTGGGFFGGGFGIVGAIEGIAIAGILNKLTNLTSIHTFVTLTTNFGEAHLHYAGIEPGALRIARPYVFHRLWQCTHDWARSKSALIEQARATGRFSAAEVKASQSVYPRNRNGLIPQRKWIFGGKCKTFVPVSSGRDWCREGRAQTAIG